MSLTERLLWSVPFGFYAVASAVAWIRDERMFRRIRQAHEADLAAIRAEAGQREGGDG